MSVISYIPIEWDLETPINVTNLDKMDTAISELTTAVNVANGESTINPTGTELIPMQALNGDALKINYNALAKAIIEQYTGSTLIGSAQSVQDAFTAVVAQSATDLATKENIDTNGTYTTLTSGVYYIKKHGWVNITAFAQGKTLAQHTWYTLGTLPTGYRPTGTVYGSATIGNNAQYPGLVRVETDGKVEAYTHTAVTSNLVAFNITFAVAG